MAVIHTFLDESLFWEISSFLPGRFTQAWSGCRGGSVRAKVDSC